MKSHLPAPYGDPKASTNYFGTWEIQTPYGAIITVYTEVKLKKGDPLIIEGRHFTVSYAGVHPGKLVNIVILREGWKDKLITWWSKKSFKKRKRGGSIGSNA